LQSLGRQHQLTLNTFVQGALALLLSRYSGKDDVVFGAVVSGRPSDLAGIESMVGLFVNTLPVRVHVSPDSSLRSWLHQLQAQQVEMRRFEFSPLVDIQGWSDVPRDLPLFENLYVFQNYPVEAPASDPDMNLAIRDYHVTERGNYPLTFTVGQDAQLSIKVLYDCSCFDTHTIQRMLGHLQTLLEGMVDNPTQRLANLPLLTDSERHQLLVAWNDTTTAYPKDQCLHQLFEAQVEHTPDAVALVLDDQHVSYRELNARANQLAHHLQGLGVGPEVPVGLCVERSLEMVVGLLGILKAGGAYVPLEPSYPAERLAFMLADEDA
jgi:non-ribosomal peptide synthetase component F